MLGHHITVPDLLRQSANLPTYQIFAQSPQTFASPRMTAEIRNRLRSHIQRHHLTVFIHGPYAINPVHGLSKPQQIQCLIDNMQIAAEIGAVGVVIHVPKQLDYSYDQACQNTRDFIGAVFDGLADLAGPVLILETASGQGSEMFVNVMDLIRFVDTLDEVYRNHIRFCIDTCHILAAGHDIADQSIWEQLHSQIDWSRVSLIHLNDSKHGAGSKKDRHEHWDRGHLSQCDYTPALLASLFALEIPMILETPGELEPTDEIAYLTSIVRQFHDADQESSPDSVS